MLYLLKEAGKDLIDLYEKINAHRSFLYADRKLRDFRLTLILNIRIPIEQFKKLITPAILLLETIPGFKSLKSLH
jgi:hypothetical protein